ncbi:hypothetical protein A3B05_00065 [Candidatus Giovannonibacteria bacterium RIFCSPLOWO2_01_FULL_43_160]|uniref:Uncharacterized protein n=2 Tax=Candidatus Giovannoniibacteriota TaxID=1752738 RepID=A0A0G1IXL3_9BACT|nr:MAG: hypothetical protein UV72_C0001G0057 [Candidatus Giovannonibacteria bacterium GW2011_GWB1_43_13]KKS99740.1 MAG: hypothetical protein UV75_C0002G0121 [Candidatus Giovannonibacteria bacterium GW2011_GWA1_43_15]KKT63825.1 MAG: hypothetical protein UW55_C0001G0118 [Candidatus Giovannonibacteria bacterium GW2011_GWA2_44_26]OGF58149.1 MAG: hypothetical protein A2652_02435 [Candidatus Giovannonibacteria bacterium RIFCSPHIGHO2_01_FULL_43_140]OGF70491.1 MAG: hypothetical protein A3C76_00250 [Can
MDTVIIRIRGIDKFRVADWAMFNHEFSTRPYADLTPKDRKRADNKKVPYLRSFVLHADIDNGLTYPGVEIYENADNRSRSIYYDMKLKFSAPKLINENSLQEALPSDYHKLLTTLMERLPEIGIYITSQTIADASVSVVHFCKNIPLPADRPLRPILAELSRVDIGKAYGNTKDIRSKNQNENETLHLFCGTREWAFYDKIQEMLRPSGKSLEKQKTAYEKEVIELYNLQNTEVFRYEYRLNKAQTIRSEVNRFLKRPYATPVKLSDLFTENLWKDILNASWQRILAKPENQIALLNSNGDIDLLLHILKRAKEKEQSVHSYNKALISYALASIIKKHGAKTLRKEMGKVWSKKSDSRLDEKLATAQKLANDLPLSDGTLYIGQELQKFEPISLEYLSTCKDKKDNIQ